MPAAWVECMPIYYYISIMMCTCMHGYIDVCVCTCILTRYMDMLVADVCACTCIHPYICVSMYLVYIHRPYVYTFTYSVYECPVCSQRVQVHLNVQTPINKYTFTSIPFPPLFCTPPCTLHLHFTWTICTVTGHRAARPALGSQRSVNLIHIKMMCFIIKVKRLPKVRVIDIH